MLDKTNIKIERETMKHKIDKKSFAGIFSIPVKSKKTTTQKNTRFSKLQKLAYKYNYLLEKECGNYIIDDNDGGEWVCRTLNEVEEILTK